MIKYIITPVCNLKELRVINAIIFAFAHLMVERKQTAVSTDLFHCIQLSLDRHYELFALSGNKHDISSENHRQEIETAAINYNIYYSLRRIECTY